MDAQELRHGLAYYTGSEMLFRHSLNPAIHYTEGVRFFAQNAGGGAYWLLDILATQPEILKGVEKHGMCVVVLKVSNGKADLTVARDYVEDLGAFEEIVYTRHIDFTDCPEGHWKLYFIDNVVLLPSEY